MNASSLLVVRHALGGMVFVSLTWSCMMMRKITSVATLLFLITYGVEAATIANVMAQQRPKSNLVDVYYDLVVSGGGSLDVSLSI